MSERRSHSIAGPDDLVLTAGDASVVVDLGNGGRLSSLQLSGLELLVTSGTLGPMQWGCYPMVPWAGRVRNGRFDFAAVAYQLPTNLPPHSAHGVGFTSAWDRLDDESIAVDLAPPWPFGGRATERFELTESDLTITLTVEAEMEMPVMMGWHPWFNRFLGHRDSPANDMAAELRFGPARMYELDETAIPTGALIDAPPGPWDNCFVSLEREPSIRWPGLVNLELTSSCDHWVIYDQPEQALCVEPQSAAPDQFNRQPQVLAAGQRTESWFRLRWS